MAFFLLTYALFIDVWYNNSDVNNKCSGVNYIINNSQKKQK